MQAKPRAISSAPASTGTPTTSHTGQTEADMPAMIIHERPLRLMLTLREAATAMGWSVAHLYRLIDRHEISTVGTGRARRVPLRTLESWIDHQLDVTTDEAPVTAPSRAPELLQGRAAPKRGGVS